MLLHSQPITDRNLTCIEPCVEDAKTLVGQLQSQLHQHPNKRLRYVFTALANGDASVRFLAFYLW